MKTFSLRRRTDAEYKAWLDDMEVHARGAGRGGDTRLLKAISALRAERGRGLRVQAIVDLLSTLRALNEDVATYAQARKATSRGKSYRAIREAALRGIAQRGQRRPKGTNGGASM